MGYNYPVVIPVHSNPLIHNILSYDASCQSFSWAKWHTCCKSHVWTILRVWLAWVSKPLNWSAITTEYHRNNWTFFKIRYIYTKGRNLTFKIVYSTGLGGSQRITETENQHEETRQNQSSTLGSLHNQHLRYAIDIYRIIQDGARKHKRRIERRVFYEQDLFGWIWLFMRATNSMRR